MKQPLKLRPYQTDALGEVDSLFDSGNSEVVLAACPSAGKTEMAMSRILANPKSRFLILTHGQTVLKTMWADRLARAGIGASNNPNDDARVYYGLPHAYHSNFKFKIDELIIDEAHEFRHAEDGMVKTIIDRCKPKRILNLTATPSKFIARGTPSVIIPAQDLIEQDYVSDVYFGVFSTSMNLTEDDYNNDDDTTVDGTKKLENTVDETMKQLLPALIARLKETHYLSDGPAPRKYTGTMAKLHKTMIACRSIKQAEKVYKYLKTEGVGCVLSNSENDIDSENIDRFYLDTTITVLVVVNRAILGFNLPDLVNIIDLTGTFNIDRIYQMYGRVMRKDDKHKRKYFFKLSSHEDAEYTKFNMTAALCMIKRDFIERFNGKNLNAMQIPVTYNTSINRDGKGNRARLLSKDRFSSLDDLFKNEVRSAALLKTVQEGHSKFLERAYTTFADIKRNVFNQQTKGYWTLSRCIQDAKKYNTAQDWRKNSSSAHSIAYTNGWFDSCCSHFDQMKKHNGYWTKSRCIEDAKRFNHASDWRRGGGGAVHSAVKNGWYDECTSHMVYKLKTPMWTKEKCMKEALKFKTRSDWADKSTSSYTLSHRKGWYDECVSHMKEWSNRKTIINLDTGKCFPSVNSAARSIHAHNSSVRAAIKRGGRCYGYRFAYYNPKKHSHLVKKKVK